MKCERCEKENASFDEYDIILCENCTNDLDAALKAFYEKKYCPHRRLVSPNPEMGTNYPFQIKCLDCGALWDTLVDDEAEWEMIEEDEK